MWICCNCGHYGLRQGLQEEADRICVLGLHPRPPSTIRKRCLSVFTWRPGSTNCQVDTVQTRLHHLQPVGDAQGSTLPEGGSGHCCYLGGAARCSCGAAYMIKKGLTASVFSAAAIPQSAPRCPPRFRPSRTCGHFCLHLTALGWTFPVEPILRHKFYVEGWSGV